MELTLSAGCWIKFCMWLTNVKCLYNYYSVSYFPSYNITSHCSAVEHKTPTRILHLTVFLASVLISIQVFLMFWPIQVPFFAIYSLVSPCPIFLGVQLYGLPGCIFRRFSQCMAQPSPLTFPDLQIYSRLLCTLPQLFIYYVVWQENSQYFPEAFIYIDLQPGTF